jgi:molybdenum cofactor biosynthesis protein B
MSKSLHHGPEPHREHRHHSGPVRFAVLTTSDSRTADTDDSGRVAVEIIRAGGHALHSHGIVPNDAARIRRAVNRLLKERVRLIITTGGTGCGERDVTVEAVTPLMKKKLDGFGELFRQMSYKQIRTACIMSRAELGVSNGCVIACLPGSPKAVAFGLKSILLPELDHILWESRRR